MTTSRAILGFFLLSLFQAACSGSSAAGIPDVDVSGTDAPTPPDGTPPAGGGNGAGHGGSNGNGGNGGAPTPPVPSNAAPEIKSVELDRSTLGPGETVKITVVVVDADGAADLGSGVLVSSSSPSTTIATLSAKPSSVDVFQATIGTAAFHDAQALTLAPGETTERGFLVRFEDKGGHAVTKPLTLTFSGKTKGICAGGVVGSFFRDCVACTAACPAGTACLGNVCAKRLDCGFASFSCADRCAESGATCLGMVAVTYSDPALQAALNSCNTATKASFSFGAAGCAATLGPGAVRGCYCKN
jgi:hypothetical protein